MTPELGVEKKWAEPSHRAEYALRREWLRPGAHFGGSLHVRGARRESRAAANQARGRRGPRGRWRSDRAAHRGQQRSRAHQQAARRAQHTC